MKLTKFNCFLCGRKAGHNKKDDTIYRIEVHECYFNGKANRDRCIYYYLKVPLCKSIDGSGCHGKAHEHKYSMKAEIMTKLGFSEENQERINRIMNGTEKYMLSEDKFFMGAVKKTMQEMWT